MHHKTQSHPLLGKLYSTVGTLNGQINAGLTKFEGLIDFNNKAQVSETFIFKF